MTTAVESMLAREYLRVSIDKSGRERSPEEQHDDNARTAEGRGWALGKAYKDIGSASRYAAKTREAFGKLLADLENGRFGAGVLILWESSRGSRKVSEWLRLIEACDARSVLIHVTADGKTYDPGNARDRRSLLEDAVDGEYESSKTSKRGKRAAAANAAEGRPSGRIPYGYKRIYDSTSSTRRLIAQEREPEEAKIVKELFDRIHKGHSLLSIEKDFAKRGILTRQRYDKDKAPLDRVPFSSQHLRSLATTRAYVGERIHDPGRDQNHRRRLSDKATITKAVWPPLVSRAKFLAVQRMLSAPERVTTRPGGARHLLSMIGRCDVCSGPISVRHNNERTGQEYTCHKSGHVRIAYDELNLLVEKVMLAYLARPDHAEKLTVGADSAEVEAARDRIATIRAEFDDLADKVGRGEVSATLAARAEPGILARLKAAELAEQELSTPSILHGLITPGADVARRWKTVPMSAKRRVARILLVPNVLGELRVTRSLTPGHRCPVKDRIMWRTS